MPSMTWRTSHPFLEWSLTANALLQKKRRGDSQALIVHCLASAQLGEHYCEAYIRFATMD